MAATVAWDLITATTHRETSQKRRVVGGQMEPLMVIMQANTQLIGPVVMQMVTKPAVTVEVVMVVITAAAIMIVLITRRLMHVIANKDVNGLIPSVVEMITILKYTYQLKIPNVFEVIQRPSLHGTPLKEMGGM
jgi:hypothetical protein